MNPIDELISLMDAKYNSETDIEAAFDKIADILLNKVKITRGNKCYYIGEIEFRAISFFIGIIGLLLIVKGALEK